MAENKLLAPPPMREGVAVHSTSLCSTAAARCSCGPPTLQICKMRSSNKARAGQTDLPSGYHLTSNKYK